MRRLILHIKLGLIFLTGIALFSGCLPMLEQAELLKKNSVVSSLLAYKPFAYEPMYFYDTPSIGFGGFQLRGGLTDRIEISGQADFERAYAGAKFLIYSGHDNIFSAKLSIGTLILQEMLPSIVKPALFYGRKINDNFSLYGGTALEYRNPTDYAGMIFIGGTIKPFKLQMHCIKIECGFVRHITFSDNDFFYAGLGIDFQIF